MIFDDPILGGLLGDDTMLALWSSKRQLQHMLAFEAAWSRALGDETGAAAIEQVKLDVEAIRVGMSKDGVPIPALVRQLKAIAGPDVHKGATSQDVIDTALSLTLRETSDALDKRLAALGDALAALAHTHGDARMMGRTRMQAAMPITVQNRIASWATPLADHRARLKALRPQVERVQIGGPAGDRAGIAPSVVSAVAQSLDLEATDRAWHSQRDGIGAYGSWLSLVTGTLGKLGQDICLMAQQGVDEIALAGGGGSSAMAHKSNPVLAELLVTLARFNAAQLGGLHQALVHEQERSGAAWTLEWMILPQMAAATGRALSAASELISKIERIGSGAAARRTDG